jgi:hypothetical protein
MTIPFAHRHQPCLHHLNHQINGVKGQHAYTLILIFSSRPPIAPHTIALRTQHSYEQKQSVECAPSFRAVCNGLSPITKRKAFGVGSLHKNAKVFGGNSFAQVVVISNGWRMSAFRGQPPHQQAFVTRNRTLRRVQSDGQIHASPTFWARETVNGATKITLNKRVDDLSS